MKAVETRNVEKGQWLYWAVGIPLTPAIMALTLFWAGKIDNVDKLMSGSIPG